ncbi:MAG TPA: IPT/TIG domain-containing protein [Acidobacteriota bacterium]
MKKSLQAPVAILVSCFLGILTFLYAHERSGAIPQRATGPAAQIIIDPSIPGATEVTVNEGNTLQLTPRVLDSSGNVIDGAPLSYNSLSSDIARVDTGGNIQGKRAGFSTLTVTSGGVVATAAISVVSITSGPAGFEITGVAQDRASRLFLADTRDHTVLLADNLQKTPSIYAGVNQTPGYTDDERLKSLFKNPAFLWFNEAEPSLYVSDSSNNVIRLVRPGSPGRVETLAGTGQIGSRDGPLNQATFNNPQGIAYDGRGNLWVVDSGSHTIRRINLLSRTVETIAGRAGVAGLADGPGAVALFNLPVGISFEPVPFGQQLAGTGTPPSAVSMIVADAGNGRLRRIKDDGRTIQVESITAIVPSTALEMKSDNGMQAVNAISPVRLNSPTGVAVDPFGNIYATEPSTGQVKTILKNGNVVSAAQANANTFSSPKGIAISQSGKVIVAESGSSGREIRYGGPTLFSVAPQQVSNRGGTQLTIKGTNFAPDTIVIVAGVVISNIEVKDTQTISFIAPPLPSGPATLTVQNRGGLAQSALLIKAVPLSQLSAGQITTVAGGASFAGDGLVATAASISHPFGIAVDPAGNLYVADTFQNRIRKISAQTGVITTVAGIGQFRFTSDIGDDGPAVAAALTFPNGIAVDTVGNLFIADTAADRVRKVAAGTGVITTFAGSGETGFFGDNGPATGANLNSPQAIAVDASGNVFIADTSNNRIRKVAAGTGIITTVVGSGQAGFSGDNGPATLAALNGPSGIAVDVVGNLFLADAGNHRIRKVSTSGIITTVAGSGPIGEGAGGFSGDNGPATAAVLNTPFGVAVDATGNIFIADTGNHRIRKIGTDGIITTVAGNGLAGGSFSGDDGPATLAGLAAPIGVVVDAAGNFLIADTLNHRVRKVSAGIGATGTPIITTIAGNGQGGFVGDNGPATSAAFSVPIGIAFDSVGNLFIADTINNRIRKVDASSGIIVTVAGTGELGFSGDGGAAVNARLFFPFAVAVDRTGNLFIADTFNSLIRKVDTRGIITTVAGDGEVGFTGDNSPAVSAALSLPSSVAVDSAGNLFIADGNFALEIGNQRIRRVDARTGIITTVAGTGRRDFSGDGGLATLAAFDFPMGIAIDAGGNLFIADTNNDRIRKVAAGSGIIATVAGGGHPADGLGDNGPATAAALSNPVGVTVDALGNLFIADSDNFRIRKVAAATGIITTVAGSGQEGFSGDNGPATAAALGPTAVIFDAAGNLFIADAANSRIRAVVVGQVTIRPRRRP